MTPPRKPPSPLHSSLLLPFLILTFSLAVATAQKSNFATVDKSSEGCPLRGGGSLKLGEDRLFKKHPQNCTILECRESGARPVTHQCSPTPCLNPQRKNQACCAYCPEGPSCRLPNNDTLWGKRTKVVGSTVCQCPVQQTQDGWSEDLTTAQCFVPTTQPPTTPAPNCRLPQGADGGDGKKKGEGDSATDVLEPGKEKIVPKDNNCRKYVCDVRGQLTTYEGTCPALNCSTNGTRGEGECCPTCPDDPNSNSTEPTAYVEAKKPQGKVIYVDIFTFLNMLLGGGVRSSGSSRGGGGGGGFFIVHHGGWRGGGGGHRRHRNGQFFG